MAIAICNHSHPPNSCNQSIQSVIVITNTNPGKAPKSFPTTIHGPEAASEARGKTYYYGPQWVYMGFNSNSQPQKYPKLLRNIVFQRRRRWFGGSYGLGRSARTFAQLYIDSYKDMNINMPPLDPVSRIMRRMGLPGAGRQRSQAIWEKRKRYFWGFAQFTFHLETTFLLSATLLLTIHYTQCPCMVLLVVLVRLQLISKLLLEFRKS